MRCKLGHRSPTNSDKSRFHDGANSLFAWKFRIVHCRRLRLSDSKCCHNARWWNSRNCPMECSRRGVANGADGWIQGTFCRHPGMVGTARRPWWRGSCFQIDRTMYERERSCRWGTWSDSWICRRIRCFRFLSSRCRRHRHRCQMGRSNEGAKSKRSKRDLYNRVISDGWNNTLLYLWGGLVPSIRRKTINKRVFEHYHQYSDMRLTFGILKSYSNTLRI